MVLYVLAPLHERLDSSKSFRCWTFRFDNAIRTEVTTILMPSWATRVAIEKVWGRCFSSRSPNNLDGVEVNPFASSYLVGRLKWVDSLVGSNPSSSFMFITPCPDHQIQFYVNIKLDFADRGKGDKHLEDGSYRYLFCTYVSRVTCHMATRLNGRDGFGTFQRGRIHVSIDIFNLNSFLFRRWETIIVFPPSRGLLSGFNIYAVYVFPNRT